MAVIDVVDNHSGTEGGLLRRVPSIRYGSLDDVNWYGLPVQIWVTKVDVASLSHQKPTKEE